MPVGRHRQGCILQYALARAETRRYLRQDVGTRQFPVLLFSLRAIAMLLPGGRMAAIADSLPLAAEIRWSGSPQRARCPFGRDRQGCLLPIITANAFGIG